MKHPASEQWMTLLYGESTAEEKRALTDHLNECGECRAHVAKWRGAMKSLNDWRVPVARKRAAPTPVRWAAAAAVVVGLGIVLGRFAFSPVEGKLRIAMESQMQQQVAALRAEVTRELEQKHEAVMAQVLAAADARIVANTERLSEEFARTLEASRAADREVFLAALKELDDKRQDQIASLRKGLEAVVVLADYGFEATQQRLAQLADSTQPAP
jgi:hypothetical protein